MNKYLSMLALACASIAVSTPQAAAETTVAALNKNAMKSAKKPVKKVAKKALAKESANAADNDKHPDIAGLSGTNFNCDLGARITVYERAGDNEQIKLRWNKRVHELKRVATSTGAHRFEDKEAGLVWIHIPAKAMLLDSKKGQQLANECRNPQQMVASKK